MSTYEESFTINPPIFKIKNEFDKPNNQINGIVIDKTVTQALNLKQDKMKGKSLSANDYTNEDKNKLYFVSDNFPILVNTVSSKVDNVEFNEYKNETINILDNKVNKDGNKVLSTHDFTTILKTKLEGLYNYDDTILATKLNQLENSLNTILKDENATAVIDTFQEIENFLQGITNTKTLTGLLQDLKSDIVTLCSNTYIAKPANGKSSQFLKGDGSVDNNVYLTGINKSQVEGVLTGNITSHTHSQYLTSHQSLTNYVDRSNAQEISGIKTFINDVNMGGTGSTGNKITWARNTDYAHIFFKNDSDADGDSYLGFQTGDNGNEYFRFSHISGGKESVWATIKSGGITSGSFIKSGGTSSQFLKGDGSVDNNVYLTGINKSQVENVLTGNITSHTHSQYLTSHQSLANYVTLGTTQTITGQKTFSNGSWVLQSNESNEITDVAFANNTIEQGAFANRLNAIKHGLDFKWYNSHWVIGNIRSGSTETDGFGIGLKNDNNKLDLGLRVTKNAIYAQSFIKNGGTSSQFLKADGSVDGNIYLTTSSASSTYLPKSSYTASDVLDKVKSVDGSGSGLDADLLDGVDSSGFYRRLGNSNSGSAGGTGWRDKLSQTVGVYYGHESNVGNIAWYNTEYSQLLFQDNNNVLFRTKHYSASWGSWHTLAKTSDNVASATKLANSRAIWGQSFNGEGNVNNTLHLYVSGGGNYNEGIRLYGTAKDSTWSNIHFGCDPSVTVGTHANQWILGRNASNNFVLDVNGSSGNIMTWLKNGNVGIGTSSPTYKLHVNGAIKSSNLTTDSITLTSNKKILIEGDVYKTWLGTEAQFNAIATKDANTIYYIKE